MYGLDLIAQGKYEASILTVYYENEKNLVCLTLKSLKWNNLNRKSDIMTIVSWKLIFFDLSNEWLQKDKKGH